MRVTGGQWRGRKLIPPKTMNTRPTTDRAREGICSALASRDCIKDANVLDLFAGTGAVSFEFLSRGASHSTLIESDSAMRNTIVRNAEALGSKQSIHVATINLTLASSRALDDLLRVTQGPFDLVYADPPYRQFTDFLPLFHLIAASSLVTAGSLFLLETASSTKADFTSPFSDAKPYRYGDTTIWLLTIKNQSACL
ncbi:MAG: RsmD family RNA methyltransferase [Myxococcales bacterium]|nr:MAG: RsmD family RNA methyltransferase [Myxococcales bacterium]